MRYVVELNIVRHLDNGKLISGHRTHVITLSNLEAVQRVAETISDGVAGWDSDISPDDVLEYDDDLDA